MSVRFPFMMLATLLACGDRQVREGTSASPLETAIARDLTARFGVPATTRCDYFAGWAFRCRAELPDRTVLPIAIGLVGKEREWRIDGRVIETAPIASYVQGVLEDLHVAQTAMCGPRIVRLGSDERLACSLSGGGTAFVDIASDGTPRLELALDPAVAAVRAEATRDRELVRASHALEKLDGEDEDDEAPTDGAVQ